MGHTDILYLKTQSVLAIKPTPVIRWKSPAKKEKHQETGQDEGRTRRNEERTSE